MTKAEILQAIHNPLGVDTMTGVKYRTRSMMGRCQGGYCQMRIEQLIEQELGKKRQKCSMSGKVLMSYLERYGRCDCEHGT